MLLLIPGIAAFTQSFTGLWKGTITRDFGDAIITDSIELNLKEKEGLITGYSILYLKPGGYIKSLLEGYYQQSNKTLRLTETSIDYTNLPGDNNEFFLDRYLLTYNEKNRLVLTGKSIPYEKTAVYSRSKIYLKKG